MARLKSIKNTHENRQTGNGENEGADGTSVNQQKRANQENEVMATTSLNGSPVACCLPSSLSLDICVSIAVISDIGFELHYGDDRFEEKVLSLLIGLLPCIRSLPQRDPTVWNIKEHLLSHSVKTAHHDQLRTKSFLKLQGTQNALQQKTKPANKIKVRREVNLNKFGS